jgi:hypothetical protein
MNTTEVLSIENISDLEIVQLFATKSERQWNATCANIKSARGGEYPPDWYSKIVLSGIMSVIANNWKK